MENAKLKKIMFENTLVKKYLSLEASFSQNFTSCTPEMYLTSGVNNYPTINFSLVLSPAATVCILSPSYKDVHRASSGRLSCKCLRDARR